MTTGLACLALLIVAMLLPLAFRAPAGEPAAGKLTLDEKTAIFVDWWYDDGEMDVSVEHVESDEDDAAGFCEERMEELAARCIDDRGFRMEEAEVFGEERVDLRSEDGALRLCRMWIQARGDWQNWLDVCFDADTGMIYYLYLSRECQNDPDLYALAPEERPTAESVAKGLARASDGDLRRFLDDGDSGGAALITCDDGSLCYTISCVYYDALIDIRVGVV